MKRYTFVTTYIVEARNEEGARETVKQLGTVLDFQGTENWTRLTNVKDVRKPCEKCQQYDCPSLRGCDL